LVDGLKTINLKQGDFVLREGDDGEEFFIIEDGTVECLKFHQASKKKGFIMVRELHSGEHFGELALINNQKRSLSIRVKSPNGCKLLTLDRDTFTRILGSIEKHLKKDYDAKFDESYKQHTKGELKSKLSMIDVESVTSSEGGEKSIADIKK